MMMAQDFKASAVLAGMHAREKPEPAVENAKAKFSEGCGLSVNAVILIGAAIVALAADQQPVSPSAQVHLSLGGDDCSL